MFDIKEEKWMNNIVKKVKLMDSKDKNKFVLFECINTKNEREKLSEEENNYLAIIRGDVYEVSQGIYDDIIIMLNWADWDILSSYGLIKEYIEKNMFNKDIPIFFIIGADHPFAMQHVAVLAANGFVTGDQLVDLDNNYIMVKTTYQKYKELNKNYVLHHYSTK